MAKTATCYGCGQAGHFERDCPNAAYIGENSKKPPWCGICDEMTRLIDRGNAMSRCQSCHPLKSHLFRGHKRCPQCKMVVYDWDQGACGNHKAPQAPILAGWN